MLIFIWDVLKQILTYIYDLLHFVYRGFEWTLIKIFHIIRFTWNQAIRFCEWIISRIKDFFHPSDAFNQIWHQIITQLHIQLSILIMDIFTFVIAFYYL